MTVIATKELVRCSICNKVVQKQEYCPRCGKLLIRNMKSVSPTKNEEMVLEKNQFEKIQEKVETGPTEQLEKLRLKIELSEKERREIIEKESDEKDLLVGLEDEKDNLGEGIMGRNTESKDIVIDDSEEEAKFTSFEGKKIAFTPDKYTMETVHKIAKNIKYEAYLVNLLKEDEITEETFLGLYNGIAEDTHKMVLRRGEIITEIEESIKNHRQIITSAEQGMKLLDIRKSIDDASEEEYEVKSAALKWDIENYGGRINEEDQKATYLKNLGKLIDAKELEKLTNDVHTSTNTLSKLSISESVKDKIQDSMKEALTILKETSSSR